ncbi:MAG TPA: hypothetical protein VNY31_01850 [Solirubrobacteraceae bacterium]|jgi:hypothetical protein|nr:hypothetical protein [Solirubrobacteraceae bacterium]
MLRNLNRVGFYAEFVRPVAVSYYNCFVEIHPSARKHDVADEDVEHAAEHAMTIEDQDDDTRLYIGPARPATLRYLRS